MERKSSNRVDVRSALGVVAGVALIRGAIYTAAATSTFTHTSAMSFTLLALVIAAGVTLPVYQPWRFKGRVSEGDILRLVSVGALVAVCTCLSVYTLRVVGPVRAVLLEHADVALVPAMGFLLARHRRVPVFRGALLAIVACVLIAWYDPHQVEVAAHQAELAASLRAMAGEVAAPMHRPRRTRPGGVDGPVGTYLPSRRRHDGAGGLHEADEEGAGENKWRPPVHRAAAGAIDDGSTSGDVPRPLADPVVASDGEGDAVDESSGNVNEGSGDGSADGSTPPAQWWNKAADSAAARAGDDVAAAYREVAAAIAAKAAADAAAAINGEAGAVGGGGSSSTEGEAQEVAAPQSPPSPRDALDAPAVDAAPDEDAAAADAGSASAELTPEEEALLREMQRNTGDEGDGAPSSPVDAGAADAGAADAGAADAGTADAGTAAADSIPAEGGEAPEDGSGSLLPPARGRVLVQQRARLEQMNAAQARQRAAAAARTGSAPEPFTMDPALQPFPPPPAAPMPALPLLARAGAPSADFSGGAPPIDAAGAAARAKADFDIMSRVLGPTASPVAATTRPASSSASLFRKGAALLLAQAERVRRVIDQHERSSVLLATALLAVGAWLNNVRRGIQRRLSADTGISSRRLHSLVLCVAVLFWAPLTLARWVLLAATTGSVASAAEDAAVATAVSGIRAVASVLPYGGVMGGVGGVGDEHASPSLLWFLLIAGLFALGVLVYGEFALDMPLSGASTHHTLLSSTTSGSTGSGGGGAGGRSGSSVGGSGELVAGGAAALPGLLAGGDGGGGSSGSASAAAMADSTLLKLVSLSAAFLVAVILSPSRSAPGYPSQTSSLLLWGGLILLAPGLAAAGGLDGAQAGRLLDSLLRSSTTGGLAAGGGGTSPGGVCGAIVSLLQGSSAPSPGQVYSAESGGYVARAGGGKAHQGGARGGVGGSGGGVGSACSSAALRRVFRHIWDDNNSRRIFTFLCLNFAFMFVEIAVGFLSNSLGLLSDAGHMFFDNASLFIGLYASYMARWKSDERYTYGYGRYEVLAGFVNAIFLVFVAISVVMEALERLWEPPEIHGEHLLIVSVGGLLVNIVGLIFFHDVAHAHSHGGGGGGGGGHGECSGGHGHSHGGGGGGGGNENMMGVYLHVMADALGSVGVIISSLLIQWYGWHLADPIASIAISTLILASVVPLISVTVGPLLSRTPEHVEGALAEAVAALKRAPDVASVDAVHFWKHHAEILVGSLHITPAAGTDPQRVLRRVLAVFRGLGVTNCTVQLNSATPAGGKKEGAGAEGV